MCLWVSLCETGNFYSFFAFGKSRVFLYVCLCVCVFCSQFGPIAPLVKMIMIRTVKSKQQHFPAIPSSRVVKRHIYATCITIIFGIEKICAAATWSVSHGPNSLNAIFKQPSCGPDITKYTFILVSLTYQIDLLAVEKTILRTCVSVYF